MGLSIVLEDFKVDEKQREQYEKGRHALVALESYSKAFFDERNLDEVVVEGIPFANPTWITLDTHLSDIKSFAEQFFQYKNHVILGNGGSIKPAMGIYQALIRNNSGARLIPVNSENPDDAAFKLLHHPPNSLDTTNTVVYAISKSGENFLVVALAPTFLNKGYTVVGITENKPSTLRAILNKSHSACFDHPNVGGRFSGKHLNSLLPLYAAASYKIQLKKSQRQGPSAEDKAPVLALDSFVSGSLHMAQKIRPDIRIEDNPAKILALLLYKAELAGMTEIFMPVYHKRLMASAAHITQLFHETYCKNGQGQTVLLLEGPECQHDSNQRYFGGRQNMAGIVVGVKSYGNELTVNTSGYEGISFQQRGKLGQINGLPFADVLANERVGVYNTARKNGMSIISIMLDALDGESFGKYLSLMQGIAVYSAFLRGSRWEDQPAVEASKKKTIEMCFGAACNDPKQVIHY